jgi:hypothetical protein
MAVVVLILLIIPLQMETNIAVLADGIMVKNVNQWVDAVTQAMAVAAVNIRLLGKDCMAGD